MKFMLKISEDILLIIILILSIPTIPFLILLSKVNESLDRNDP
jgi:hypothetical protein